MKCVIQWIDSVGHPTPDNNEATAMAHFHEPIWAVPTGSSTNTIVKYSDKIRDSYPICDEHLAMVENNWRFPHPKGAWSFTSLDTGKEI